jgi:hypothetical protein
MNILKGLYFPGTGPGEAGAGSLLCLLDKIEYYLVVEGEGEEADRDESPERQGRVVLPLGDDRERFLALVREIKAHAADFYSGYLATLSAPGPADRDEPSVRQLIAGLRGEKEEGGPDPLVTEKIWQARLVLQLAGILARERLELNLGLTELNRAEQAVFTALRGEAAGPDADEGDRFVEFGGGIRQDSLEGYGIDRLVRAWSVFYTMDPEPPPLLVTDSEAAAAILFDEWEDASGVRPALLAEIDLPEATSPEAIPACRAELAESRLAMIDAVKDVLAPRGAAGPDALKEAVKLWQDRVSAKAGRTTVLSLYLLAEQAGGGAWSRISGVPVAANDGERVRIVAILKPAP